MTFAPSTLGRCSTQRGFAEVTELAFDDAPSYDPKQGDAVAAALAAMPEAARLRELSLTAGQLGPVGLRALLSSPHLAGLTRLILDFSHLPSLEPDHLTDLPARPALAELSLTEFNVPTSTLPDLLASPPLASLRSLDLSENEIDPTELDGPVAWPASLQVLKLRKCRLDAFLPTALLEEAPWQTLHTLHLSRNNLDAEAIRRLVAGLGRGALLVLSLAENRLGWEGAEALAAVPGLASLLELNLRKNGLGPDATEALHDSDHLAGLHRLVLSDNPLGDAGGAALLWHAWPALRELLIDRCRLTDDGIEELVLATGLKPLTRLNLSRNDVGKKAIRRLLGCPLGARLTHLGLNDCRLDNDPGSHQRVRHARPPARAGPGGGPGPGARLSGAGRLQPFAVAAGRLLAQAPVPRRRRRHERTLPGGSFTTDFFFAWDYGD
jgi:hypothetical protein